MTPESPRGRRPYVAAIDGVRTATIVAVVVVHAIIFGLVPGAGAIGGALQMLWQWGRESFMVITGFVLVYQYGDRTVDWRRFWKKRYHDVGAPYLFWLAVFLVGTVPLWPVVPFLRRYAEVLPSGNGHLYYVVITAELYAVAPLLMALMRVARRRPWRWAALAVAWEIVPWTLVAVTHQSAWAPPLWVSTYGGYFLLGGLAASHWERVRAWCSAHRGEILMAWLAAAALLLAVFDATWLRTHQLAAATNVFQPVSVVYSVATIVAVWTAATWWMERGASAAEHPWLSRMGNTSFGIYLVHPLFLHGWLRLVEASGIAVSPWVNTLVTAAMTLGASVVLVSLLQRQPWTAWMVGKPRTPKSASRVTGRLAHAWQQSH